MKFVFLDLAAFGVFAPGERINFDTRPGSLSLVYGPNEAGKSSALRAIHHFLFQIPERTSDNFRHSNSDLRIGALLEAPDGRREYFLRRKGRKATLRNENDREVVPENRLTAFYGHMTEQSFTAMFGLGHRDLVQGGRDIVSGGGSLGELIFAAGTGIRRLRAVQVEIREQAQTLFSPRGKKPIINHYLSQYNKIKREMEAARLDHESWRFHHDLFEKTQTGLAHLAQRLAGLQTEKNRLERIQNALPHISRLLDVQKELASLEDIALLPPGFQNSLEDLTQKAYLARLNLEGARTRIQELESAQKAIRVPNALLIHQQRIESLYQDLGRLDKARIEALGYEAAENEKTEVAKKILKRLKPGLPIEKTEELRINRAREARLRELENRFNGLQSRLDALAGQKRLLVQKYQDGEKELDTIKPPENGDALGQILAKAEENRDTAQRLTGMNQEIQTSEEQIKLELSRQNLWTGSLSDLAMIQLPDPDMVDRMITRLQETEDGLLRLQRQLDENQAGQKRTKAEMDALEKDVPLISESDLAIKRSRRDKGWHLIRDRLENRVSSEADLSVFMGHFPKSDTLADAFENALEEADHIADLLRTEADRIAQKTQLAGQMQTLAMEYGELEQRRQTAFTHRTELSRQWIDLWVPCAVTPFDQPGGMKTWLAKFRELSEKAARVQAQNKEARLLEKKLEFLCSELRSVLDVNQTLLAKGYDVTDDYIALTASVKAAVDQAEARILARQTIYNNLEQMKKDLTRLDQDMDQVKQDLETWQKAWDQAIAPLGLEKETGCAEVRAVLEDYTEMFGFLDAAETARQHLETIQKDLERFSRAIQTLIPLIAPELVGKDPMAAAGDLYALLLDGRSAQTEWSSLKKQLITARQKEAAAKGQLEELENQLEAMAERANCPDRESLRKTVALSEKKRILEENQNQIKEQLTHFSGAMDLDSFTAMAKGQNVDRIQSDLEALNEQIGSLEKEKSQLHETLGREENELSKMDGGSKVADLAVDAESIKATIRNSARRYVELRMGDAVLKKTIERYRQQHQGPIINKGSSYFSRITKGAYMELRADVDPKGEPVLVAASKDMKRAVKVSAMSDGTADQLYLALRLAGLEHHLASNPPFPLILDDILINFDDDRAKAALSVLAEMANRTQVILFTHHRHIKDLAQTQLESDMLFVHEMKSRSGA